MTRLLKPQYLVGAALALCFLAASSGAQAPPVAHVSPDIGTMAPDFTLPGATRYGVLRDSIRLSDYRGKTVVLAFFFRARSKG